ncbi:ATP-grasp domain-containing protein [Streptacidiphilus jiangxiensis]|uniref:ATP-grasp domain-containing protein n=1 Tax=Streptacidiphilus jiangxiensis TaxID=235985 RepID=A0A1H7ZNP4_STRJI|nr:ATP-grasp domain-containing protein [Streptacidiphilus jiangxiensis]SEM59926.1 ATP-grasp domain-containing protein [Streptacidiphilus jiangxiensis]
MSAAADAARAGAGAAGMLIRAGNPRRLGRPLWRSALRSAAEVGAEVLVIAPPDPELVREATAIGPRLAWHAPGDPQALVGAGLAGTGPDAEGTRPAGRGGRAGLVITSDPDSATLAAAELAEAADRYDAKPVRRLLDKAATRQLAQQAGVTVADGAVWSERDGHEQGADDVLRVGDGARAGVVVKGALAWAGHQQGRARSGAEALAAARALGRDHATHVVVESFVAGVECSLEMVRHAEGTCRTTGWSVKGRTDDERHPLYRPRVTPAYEPPARLVEAARAVLDAADYQGIADFDLVCADDDRVVLLECNPRTSWATLLHWTSRGYSSVDVALLGRRPSGAGAPQWAAEFLLPDGDGDGAEAAVAAVAQAGGWVHPVVEGLRPRGFVRAESVDALAGLTVSLAEVGGLDLAAQLDAARTAHDLVARFGGPAVPR